MRAATIERIIINQFCAEACGEPLDNIIIDNIL